MICPFCEVRRILLFGTAEVIRGYISCTTVPKLNIAGQFATKSGSSGAIENFIDIGMRFGHAISHTEFSDDV
jgi:hypothetical protein